MSSVESTVSSHSSSISTLNTNLAAKLPLAGGTMTGAIDMGSGSSDDTPNVNFKTSSYGTHAIDGYGKNLRIYNTTTGAFTYIGYQNLTCSGLNLYDICQQVAGITTSTISTTVTTSGTTASAYSITGTKSGYTPIAVSPVIHTNGGYVTVAVETLSMSSGTVGITGYYANIKDSTSRSTSIKFIVTWLKN